MTSEDAIQLAEAIAARDEARAQLAASEERLTLLRQERRQQDGEIRVLHRQNAVMRDQLMALTDEDALGHLARDLSHRWAEAAKRIASDAGTIAANSESAVVTTSASG